MNRPASWVLFAYFAIILVSRFFFRHRELVRAAGDGARGQPGPERCRGALLCLLPLGIMQIAPFVGYWLHYFPIRDTDRANNFFALLSPGSSAAGVILFAAGTLLAARASRCMARWWHESPGGLCTTGPYAVIRHPLYAAYLLQGAGCMLMLGAAWSWVAWGLAAALITVRVLQEDRELANRYPDFEEYSRRVKRLVPGLF